MSLCLARRRGVASLIKVAARSLCITRRCHLFLRVHHSHSIHDRHRNGHRHRLHGRHNGHCNGNRNGHPNRFRHGCRNGHSNGRRHRHCHRHRHRVATGSRFGLVWCTVIREEKPISPNAAIVRQVRLNPAWLLTTRFLWNSHQSKGSSDKANNKPYTLVSPSKCYLLVPFSESKFAEFATAAARARVRHATPTFGDEYFEIGASPETTASSLECEPVASSCTTTSTATRHERAILEGLDTLPNGYSTYSFMKPFPGQAGAHFSPFCPLTGENPHNNVMVMAKATEARGIITVGEDDAGKNAFALPLSGVLFVSSVLVSNIRVVLCNKK
jgi:hypothetical protein